MKSVLRLDLRLRRLGRETSLLLGGSLVYSLFSFAAVIVAARALGPESYGVLALLQTSVVIVDRLVNFQSWQTIVRYGAATLHSRGWTAFFPIVKFCGMIDLITAIVGTLIACLLFYIGWGIFAWDASVFKLALLYSVTIAFHLTGTSIGILRLLGRFDILALHQSLVGVIRFVGAVSALLLSGQLLMFIMVWIVTDVIAHLLLLGLCFFSIGRVKVVSVLLADMSSAREAAPDIWRFLWATNASGAVRMSSRELDVLVVGGLLGTAPAGLYKIAKQWAQAIGKLFEPLYQVVFPELARLWSGGLAGRFHNLVVQSSVVAGGAALAIWIGIVFLGKPAISVVMGTEYMGAYQVLVLYTFAVVVSVWSLPLQPAMLAQGAAGESLRIGVASTALYFLSLGWLAYSYGLEGAAIAYLLYYLVWSILMGRSVMRRTRSVLRVLEPAAQVQRS